MWRRLFTTWVLFPLFVIAVVVGVGKILHWRYLHRIDAGVVPADSPLPAGMDAASAARIGSLNPPRRGSFQRAAGAKPAGAVRVGAFGDSFTYGLEVDEGLDWPNQLQALLQQASGQAIEVLNFGNPGFGSQQTHMMAELIGPRFALDYAVFAPLPIYWTGRDRSFTFWSPDTPRATRLGFHARYVLDGDGVTLIDVIGATERERRAAYIRFIPPWRYLRFDERPPAFLQAWLPAGRTLRNPFYYSSLPRDEEVAEIYRRLLRRLVRDGPPLLLLDTIGSVAAMVQSDPQLTARVVAAPVPQRFPYLAPQSHWSPWGQRLVAEHAARAFGIAVARPIQALETRPALGAGVSEEPAPLHSFEHVRIDIAGTRAGTLYAHPRGGFASTRLDRLPPSCRFLVVLTAPGQPLVDGVFIPLAARPSATVLTLEGAGSRVPMMLVAPDVARVDLCTRDVLGEWVDDDARTCPLAIDWDRNVPHRPLVLKIGDQAIADIGRNSGSPNPGTIWTRGTYLRAHADGHVSGDPGTLPTTGQITLVLEGGGARARRITLADYSLVEQPPAPRPPIPGLHEHARD